MWLIQSYLEFEHGYLIHKQFTAKLLHKYVAKYKNDLGVSQSQNRTWGGFERQFTLVQKLPT